jgi:hypothetical protein
MSAIRHLLPHLEEAGRKDSASHILQDSYTANLQHKHKAKIKEPGYLTGYWHKGKVVPVLN